MSLDELRERITNELVLHEGNVADWQWTRTGLPTEAAQLGITDFFRLVDDVSRSLNAQFGKILDLQATIKKVAVDNQKRLSDVQIGGFALDGERLGLSRSFVTEQWVPRLLAQIPDEGPAPKANVPETPALLGTSPQEGSGTLGGNESVIGSKPEARSGLAPADPLPTSPPPASAATSSETAESMQQKVRDILDDYKEHVPAQAIRALFRAINYDEKALADAVLAYLQANFYASENEPQGSTLREKLGSTDWRHLVWWDRHQAQPVTNPVAAGAPVSGPSGTLPNALGTSAPAPRSGSGWRDLLVALVIAGGLIGFVVILIRSNGSASDKERTRTEQADRARAAEQARTQVPNRQRTQPESRKARRKRQRDSLATAQRETARRQDNADTEATATTPISPRDEPYDELFDDVGQYGERPAKKDGQWGLWRKGRWMVLPVYDKIDVFRDGRAHVSVNGNTYDIDRNGDRIR